MKLFRIRHGLFINAIAICSLSGFIVLFALLGSTREYERTQAFFLVPFDETALSENALAKVPVVLEEVDHKDDLHVYQLRLESSSRLLNAHQIDLVAATFLKTIEAESVELVLLSTSDSQTLARFSSKPSPVIRDNQRLELYRDESIPYRSVQHGLVGILKVALQHPAHLAFWGHDLLPKFAQMPTLGLSREDRGGKRVVTALYGASMDGGSGPGLTRAQLLSCMWGWGVTGETAIYSLIGVAALICLVGILFLNLSESGPADFREALYTALAVSFLFFGGGTVYIALFPPFQGPDEADHFLTYAECNERPDLSRDALSLAQTSHFERIKFRTDERFAACDIGNPLPGGWANHVTPTEPGRSIAANMAWRVHSATLHPPTASSALLSLRFFNLAFVSSCILLTLLAVAWGGGESRLLVISAAPFILTPAFLFFAFAVSNYPFLLGGLVFQAGGLILFWRKHLDDASGRSAVMTGLLVVLGVAIASGASVNGYLSAVFWGTLATFLWGGVLSQRMGVLWGYRCLVGIFLIAVGAACIVAPSGVVDIQTHETHIPAAIYVSQVLKAFFLGFIPVAADPYVSLSFWGNLGWLDTPLPPFLCDVLRLAATGGLVCLVYASLRRRSCFRKCGSFLLATIIALVVFCIFLAGAYFFARQNIHGRYLIGLYLFTLVAAYEGYRRVLSPKITTPLGNRVVGSTICVVFMVVHTLAWFAVLCRYV